MNDKNDYKVTAARFIDGQLRAVGDPVSMTAAAAKYYTAPHGAGLELVKPVRAQRGLKPDEASSKDVTQTEG